MPDAADNLKTDMNAPSPSDPTTVNAALDNNLLDLMHQSQGVVTQTRDFFHQLDAQRTAEFRVIAGFLEKARAELRDLRPHEISEKGLPSADAELEAITRDTEVATNAIMTSAETIMGMNAGDPDLKVAIDDEVMKMFESCAFQDITGQRVSKIIKVLKQIEERLNGLSQTLGIGESAEHALTAEEIRRRDLLLNGPAIGGPETDQSAIDALFD